VATYYVDYNNGSDSNNGLGPDASNATNKPFATIAKLIAASGAMSSGDTAYLAPGVYREANVTVGISPTSETSIIGDPLNRQGFKNSSGVLVPAAPVTMSGYLTDDTTAYSANNSLSASGKDYLTFENIYFIARGILISLISCENWTLRRCVFFAVGSQNALQIQPAIDVANNLLVDSCVVFAPRGRPISIALGYSNTADYDVNITLKNSLFLTPYVVAAVEVAVAGSATSFYGGGVDVLNCTCIGRYAMQCSSAGISTTYPCTIYNSVGMGDTVLTANTTGQIIEDYNLLLGSIARQNVTAGSNSKTTECAPYLELGQSFLHGFQPRPFLSPWHQSRTLGFGGSSPPTTDLFGRPRPSGGGRTVASASAGIGAMECHDFGTENTSAADGGSGSCLELVGPGDHDIIVPVDASSTTISLKVKYDSATYGGTDYPQAILLDAGDIGVSTETETATSSASDAYETLTFTAFTPTRKSWVKIRLINRSTAGAGKCWFDSVTVRGNDTRGIDNWRAGEATLDRVRILPTIVG
jgi:hypothetical protein